MNNFEFYNPTKLLFGENQIQQLANLIPASEKVMILYGGDFVLSKNGIMEQVRKALHKHDIVEFGGIVANPDYDSCVAATEKIHKEKVTFLLAVGGGSVLDATKFTALMAAKENNITDAWQELLEEGKYHLCKTAMPLASIMTLPATGSEMNANFVISRRSIQKKRDGNLSLIYPQFSILDPTLTYTLPKKQVANGIVDAFIHVIEQYLTRNEQAKVQDEWSEGLLRVLIEEGARVFEGDNLTNYNCRANIMYAATMALNGFIATGVLQDWSTHMLGHELTASSGLDHGVTLSILLPANLKVNFEHKKEKLAQLASRVFKIEKPTQEEQAKAAITALEDFFRSLQMPCSFKEANIDASHVAKCVQSLEENGLTSLSENQFGIATAQKIYETAL